MPNEAFGTIILSHYESKFVTPPATLTLTLTLTQRRNMCVDTRWHMAGLNRE